MKTTIFSFLLLFCFCNSIFSQELQLAKDFPGTSWHFLWDIEHDDSNNLYTCSEQGILYIKRDGVWEEHDLNPETSNNARGIAIDAEGIVWIAAEDGLYRVEIGGEIQHFTTANSALLFDELRVIRYFDNKLWIGSSGGGLIIKDGNSYSQFTTENSSITTDRISDIEFTPDGTAVIIGGSNVVFYDGSWKNFNFDDLFQFNTTVRDVFIDHNQTVWFASKYGVMVYNPETDEINRLDQYPIKSYTDIWFTPNEELWIGELFEGLHYYKEDDYFYFDGNLDGVPSQVFDFHYYQDTLRVIGNIGATVTGLTINTDVKPTATYTAQLSLPCIGGQVDFINSSNLVENQEWDFGDGNSSSERAPFHIYSEGGSYETSLIVCNNFGCDTMMQTIEVKIQDEACDFLNFPTTSEPIIVNGCGGRLFDDGGETWIYSRSVTSTVTIVGDDANYLILTFNSFELSTGDYFDLYNGSDATAPLIQRFDENNLPGSEAIFTNSGQVTLVFASDDIFVDDGFELTWECGNGEPISKFDVSSSFPCNGNVSFENKSIAGDSFQWDFGNGETSIDRSPSILYQEAGSYLVKLKTWNDLGCSDTETMIDVVIDDPNCNFFLMPNDGSTLLIEDCEGRVIDEGENITGNYKINANGIATIQPGNAANITIYFDKFQIESDYDFLDIYDGQDEAAPLIGSFSGSQLEGDSLTSSGNAVTLVFRSDETEVFDGFDISWTCNENTTSAFDVTLIDEGLQVYPNPSTGNFLIDYAFDSISDIQLNIFNHLGKLVFDNTIYQTSSFSKELNLSEFGEGIYIVQITNSIRQTPIYKQLIIVE